VSADADTLEVISLTLSAVTGALHVTDGRATLELFVSNGGLLHAGTANGLEPAGVRGAWVVRRRVARLVLVAVGTVMDPAAPLPVITFTSHRRRVRGQIRQLGPFWVAEAAGPRLRLVVDDGVQATHVASRRRPGAARIRRAATRLTAPNSPVEENP
jgi:hypothetical protein